MPMSTITHNQPKQSNLADFQQTFGAYIRRGTHTTKDEALVPKRVGTLYQELVKNSILSFPKQCFPLCQQVVGEQVFDELCQKFVAHHLMDSPYFTDINDEFTQFIAQITTDSQHMTDDLPAFDLPAFLPELAHFEWAELQTDIAPNRMFTPIMPYWPDTSIKNSTTHPSKQPQLRLNGSLLLLQYQYPVQQFNQPAFFQSVSSSNEWQNMMPEPTFLAMYRHQDGDGIKTRIKTRIETLNLTPVTFVLLDFVQEKLQQQPSQKQPSQKQIQKIPQITSRPIFSNDSELLKEFLPLLGGEFNDDMLIFFKELVADLVAKQLLYVQ